MLDILSNLAFYKGVNGARAARQGVDLLWPAIPDPLRSARPPTRYYSGT